MPIKHTNHKYSLIPLLLVAVFTCTPNSHIPQLTTGTITLVVSPNVTSTQAYTYQSYNLSVPRRPQRNTQLSYSFGIKDAYTFQSNIMYFDLLVLQTFDASLIVNFIYEPLKWSKIGYNYFLSYRSDIYAGVQTYLDKQFTKLQKGYRLQSGISIGSEQQNLNEREFVVMAFLNGIRYKSANHTTNPHHLSFTFTEQYLQKSAIVLVFDGCTVGDIISLTFSYIVYAPNVVKFGSYGGTINEYEFKGRSAKNIQYLFAQYNFIALYGLSGLKTSQRNESGFSLQTELTQNYTMAYQINEWEIIKSLEITYIVMGVMPSAICQKVIQCQSKAQIYIYQTSCVSACPNNTKPMRFIDGAIECQECPPNQTYSSKTNSCQCMQGYALDNHKNCIAAPRNQLAGVTHSRSSRVDQLDQQPTLPSLQKCLTLDSIQQSNKNLFVKLKGSGVVLSDRGSNDRNFIRIVFEEGKAANSYYCNRCSVESEYYQCLLLFATNVPRGSFSMRFQSTLSKQSRVCQLVVPYDLRRNNNK